MRPSGPRYVADMLAAGPRDALVTALRNFLEREPKKAWPARKGPDGTIRMRDIDIRVLPLDRIGAPPGASGAKVVVAYFSDRRPATKRKLASAPFVVKWSEKKDLQYLKEERAFGWPELDPATEACFAKPVWLEGEVGDQEFPMLIAPFRSDFKPDVEGQEHEVQVQDIWSLLTHKSETNPDEADIWKAKTEEVAGHLRAALRTMSKVHQGHRARLERETLSYTSCYARYFRNTHPSVKWPHGSERHYVPERIFGTGDQIRFLGQDWPNPTKVLTDILESDGGSFQGVRGPIHGDLHPKNIVIAENRSIGIIDFGWAHRARHIVADYVLMEINLRAMTLPSQVHQDDVLALAAFLRPEGDVATLPASVRARAGLIQSVIWQEANNSRAAEDWTTEYLVPFLIVAYGLLAHMDHARNQLALIASVLAAAKEVYQRA
jgi:hypothetical protein